LVTDDGVPIVAVAVKTAVSEPELAVSELAPALVPRVQLPTVATPLELLVCDPPVTLPPPAVTANVTAAPATGFWFASLMMTEGGIATATPAEAVCASPAVLVIEAAAPAAEVAVNVTGVRLPVDAMSVFVPMLVPRVQPPTVAIPEELVVAAAPVTEPPPVPTLNATGTPLIGLPFWSLTKTEGWVATAAPAVPVRLVAELAVRVVATGGGVDSPPPPQEN
jgi:hypothetical protein